MPTFKYQAPVKKIKKWSEKLSLETREMRVSKRNWSTSYRRNIEDNLIKVRTKRTQGFRNRKVFDEFYQENMRN